VAAQLEQVDIHAVVALEVVCLLVAALLLVEPQPLLDLHNLLVLAALILA
jgi:hypothetical protein